VYKTSGLSYTIARCLIKVRFISLVNLIADKEVVKEMIQKNASVEKVSVEIKKILNDEPYRSKMLTNYEEIILTLDTGSASENTATLMLKYLKS
jgi:lipid-A-disaccharide synthase